jgi:pyruvate-formate lyase
MAAPADGAVRLSTYDAAMASPERYDLLRVRTGGWSEFFVAVLDFRQEYFRRRVY